jgi:hypothetical protein
VRNALGSCVDYAPALSPRSEVGGGELAFELDENLAEASPACEPCARELLAGAQARHRIFHEELVVKTFFEAEKAHRGQVKTASYTIFSYWFLEHLNCFCISLLSCSVCDL